MKKLVSILVSICISCICIAYVDAICLYTRQPLPPQEPRTITVLSEQVETPTRYVIKVDEVHDIIVDPDVDYSVYIDEDDIEIIGNLIYGEARGIESKAQKAAIAWCVLNRLDSGRWGSTVYDVVTAKNQFDGYNPNRKYSYEDFITFVECKKLARDVLERYYSEKFGNENVGRVLPKDYLFFYGKDGVNKFTKEWKDYDSLWDWSLDSPY